MVKTDIHKIGNVKMESDVELQKFSNEKNVVLLAFINSYAPKKINTVRSDAPEINIADEIAIENVLDTIKQKMGTMPDEAYLLVNTTGGGLNSSFKIAKAIRKKFKKITVFVPHVAASGGTLLAMTGNTIRMGMMSQLSPLDPQIEYKEYGRVSANCMNRSKRRYDDELATLHEDDIDFPDRHMIESLDPILYEIFNDALVMAETYIDFILEKSNYTKPVRESLCNSFIYGFPGHDFMIDKNLAKILGLHIETEDQNIEEWNLMRDWFGKYISKETDMHFIRYCIPKKLDNVNMGK